MLVLGNVLFAVGFLWLAAELFFWERSDRRLQGLLWLSISVWSVFCFHVLAAALLQLFTVFIGTFSIGVFDVLAAFLLHRVRCGRRQQYLWHKVDIGICVLLFFLTVAVGLLRYGIHLEMTYRSVDGITHYYEAYGTFLANGQKLVPQTPYHLHSGEQFYLGGEANMLRVEIE